MSDALEPALEVDVIAATLVAQSRESGDLLEHLATKLGGGLPEWTTIKRAGWFFSSRRPVRQLTLDLGPERFRIVRSPQGPVARHVRVVRGVEIGSREIAIEAWLAAVVEALRVLATQNEAARRALDGFIQDA